MLNKINSSALFIVTLGMTLSFPIYFWHNQAQQKLIQEKFKTRINKKTSDIKEKLELNMHVLNSLAAFHYSSDDITRDEFQKYTSIIMDMHPSIYSLQWLPKVPHEFKEKFEKDAQTEGYEDFFIYEPDSDGEKKRVSYRQNYYPVFYAEPLEQNRAIIGLDVGFDKNRIKAILKSSETSFASMTTLINLIENKKGMLIFYPIYKDKQIKKDVIGFFLAIINPEELISETIKNEFFDKGIAFITIKDTKSSESNGLIFSNELSDYTSDIYCENKIDFASRSWKIKAYASNDFIKIHSTKYPLIFLVLLFSITFILAFTIYVILKKQTALIETNDEMRRFQKVAITREERITELKEIIKELKKRSEINNA